MTSERVVSVETFHYFDSVLYLSFVFPPCFVFTVLLAFFVVALWILVGLFVCLFWGYFFCVCAPINVISSVRSQISACIFFLMVWGKITTAF